MKIIKGSLKNRNLSCPPDTRPVSVLVRKACFDILAQEIPGKRVLDLFAGSGALGLEALSCGAGEAVFVDIRSVCIRAINKALVQFKLSGQGRAQTKDAYQAAAAFFERGEVFDLVFLDPPYYRGLLRKALHALAEYDIVAPSGYLIGFCYRSDETGGLSEKYELLVDKSYGQSRLLVYRKI